MSNVQTGGPMRFYSAGEVAGMFGVSRMTIYRAINDGTIPAIQVRDRWVVPALAVEGMVQAAIARAEAGRFSRHPARSKGRRVQDGVLGFGCACCGGCALSGDIGIGFYGGRF